MLIHQSKNPMTRKIALFCLMFLGVSLCTISAQDDSNSYRGLKFNAQPKHQSEIGINAGHFMVIGDIVPNPGWGVGLHFRRAIDYAWSIRVDAMYGQGTGLEPRNSGGSESSPAAANPVLRGLGYGTAGNDWYHNYQTKFASVSVQGVWSLNSFSFNRSTKKWNWYALAGIGLNTFKTYHDALDGSTIYDFSRIGTDYPNVSDSRDDRRDARKDIKDILDGDYETSGELAKGRSNGDDRQFNTHADLGIGLSYKINDKFNIGIEHKATIVFGSNGDLIDGYRWRSSEDLTAYRDLVNYTSIRVNINIGKKEDSRSEPLWWVSPFDMLAEDLAEVKQRPILDLSDDDEDGVINMLDQEPESEKGYPVDTRGIALDSDGDGLLDGKDDERYSPPGYEIDGKGVAQVPQPVILSEGDVNKIVDAKLANYNPGPTGIQDWFLPIVNFGLDNYNIRTVEYGKLHQLASVMKANADIKIVATGHTDKLSGDCYNNVLSYNRANAVIDYMSSKYGIDRSRFVLNWGGENTNLVPTSTGSLMNRRVEFKVAQGETNMGKPDCGVGNAGKGSSKKGTNYSGNKEAGY
ncbi:MAG: OOP family OmpA-OmpF porin [Saprospiraceae bacterium]